MLSRSNPYFRQVELLLALMPLVGRERCFALKGGSAINLFVRDLPRLSVDLDLTFVPVKERAQSMAEMDAALARMAGAIGRALTGVEIQHGAGRPGERTKLFVKRDGVGVKVETSPVLRGAVGQPDIRGVCPAIEAQFGYAEMPLLHLHDLYAGKLCAALDRQPCAAWKRRRGRGEVRCLRRPGTRMRSPGSRQSRPQHCADWQRTCVGSGKPRARPGRRRCSGKSCRASV